MHHNSHLPSPSRLRATLLKFLLALIIVLIITGVPFNTVSADVTKTSVAADQQTTSISFEALLKEGGLSYQPKQGFREVSVEPEYVLPYEKRLRNADDTLEIRYAIRPLNRIEIAYEDPHNSAPHPNDMFEMLFRTLSETLAGRAHVISRAYTAEQAKEKFNAGWASAAVFDISPNISKEYKKAMLLTIHHNDKADAYLLMLTNDLQKHKESIKAVKDSLMFALFEKGINQPQSPGN